MTAKDSEIQTIPTTRWLPERGAVIPFGIALAAHFRKEGQSVEAFLRDEIAPLSASDLHVLRAWLHEEFGYWFIGRQ